MDSVTPPRLVERIRAGDSDAERELFARYSRPVYSIALARTRDREAARDLTQDVFLAALPQVRDGRLREAARLGAFLYGIMRNLVQNRARVHARTPPQVELTPEIAAIDGRLEFEASDRRRRVAAAMEELSADDRQILTMSLVDGLKPGEIAKALSLGDEVVRTRKSRALKRMMARVNGRVSGRLSELSRNDSGNH